MKPQSVRLIDVFVFGPILIALAFKRRKLSNTERIALGFIGAGTIFYNWNNYRKVERAALVEKT